MGALLCGSISIDLRLQSIALGAVRIMKVDLCRRLRLSGSNITLANRFARWFGETPDWMLFKRQRRVTPAQAAIEPLDNRLYLEFHNLRT
jgi:hypothetical protein